jgi:cation transport ATPase
VVLLGNDLIRFVDTVAIAQRTRRIIWQNLIGTIGVDTIGIVLAGAGSLNPVMQSSEMTGPKRSRSPRSIL